MLKIETVEPPIRFFDDFHEGQELPLITRGPMMVGHQVRWAGACDNYESEFHHDEYVAKAQGLSGILLSGPLMASWLLTTVQEWMGGAAKILRFTDQNRGSTMPRDMAFFHGRIRRAHIEEGRALIELECWISNQKGEITTPGYALVQMPRRGA